MSLPQFTDLAGRTWRLVLNYGLAKRLHQSLGVDLANAHNGQALQQLGKSDELLVATLFGLIEEQVAAQGVTPEQFAEALDGGVLEEATGALETMLTLFTRPAMRPVMETMLARKSEAQGKAIHLATAKLAGQGADDRIDLELTRLGRAIDEALADGSQGTGVRRQTPTATS